MQIPHDETGAKAEQQDTKPAKPKGKLRRFIDGRLWWLHSRYPSVITSPYDGREENEYYRKRDAEQNAKTRLPDGERVELQFLMAAELYGPSEIASLMRGIEKNGWNDPDLHSELGNATDWLRRSREVGGFGGHFSLGTVLRPGDRRMISRRLNGPVPEDMNDIVLNMLQITSSLTCVVATFHLTDQSTDRYAQILHRDRRTYREPLRSSGLRVWGVDHLKEREIREARGGLQRQASDWFRNTIPGIFTTGYLGEDLVTIEFLTTTQAEPFPENGAEIPEWMNLIFPVSSGYGAWKCDSLQQLKLSWQSGRGEQGGHGIAAMKVSGVPDEALRFCGGRDRHAFNYLAQERLDDVLSRHATIMLLRGFIGQLNTARDTIRQRSSTTKSLILVLTQIEDFFVNGLGVPRVVGELKEYAGRRRDFAWDLTQFSEVKTTREGAEPGKLVEQTRASIEHLSSRVQEMDKSARELFLQYGSLVSTRESVRTQRTMKWLTVATAILAVASIAIALSDRKYTIKERPVAQVITGPPH